MKFGPFPCVVVRTDGSPGENTYEQGYEDGLGGCFLRHLRWPPTAYMQGWNDGAEDLKEVKAFNWAKRAN